MSPMVRTLGEGKLAHQAIHARRGFTPMPPSVAQRKGEKGGKRPFLGSSRIKRKKRKQNPGDSLLRKNLCRGKNRKRKGEKGRRSTDTARGLLQLPDSEKRERRNLRGAAIRHRRRPTTFAHPPCNSA